MRCLLFLLLVSLVSASPRCDWARVFKNNGLDGFAGVSLADWVCTVEGESSFDPGAIGSNPTSSDYGLFQINSYYWCDDGKTSGSHNICNVDCNVLLTDINASIACAKQVVRSHQGIRSWRGWSRVCENRDLTNYLADCNL